MPYRPRPGTAPIPNKAGATNWVEKAGGLPSYIRRIAEHLHGKGKSVSVAIATAVNTVKRWAAGGTVTAQGGPKVTPATQAKAAAALARWNTMKAQSHANPELPESKLILLAERLSCDVSKCARMEAVDLAMVFRKGGPVSAVDLTATSDLTQKVRKSALKKGQAMKPLPGSKMPRYPMNDREDIRKAILAVGRGKGDHAKIRRHIIKCARKLGAMDMIPDSWTSKSLSVPAKYVTIDDGRAVIDLAGESYAGFEVLDFDGETFDLAWSPQSRAAALKARRAKSGGRRAGAAKRPRLVTRTVAARKATNPLVGRAARKRIRKAHRLGKGPTVRQVRKRLVRKYDVSGDSRLGRREIRALRHDRLRSKVKRLKKRIKRLNTPPGSYGRGGGMSKGATSGLASSSRSNTSTRAAVHRYGRA